MASNLDAILTQGQGQGQGQKPAADQENGEGRLTSSRVIITINKLRVDLDLLGTAMEQLIGGSDPRAISSALGSLRSAALDIEFQATRLLKGDK